MKQAVLLMAKGPATHPGPKKPVELIGNTALLDQPLDGMGRASTVSHPRQVIKETSPGKERQIIDNLTVLQPTR